MDTEQYIFLCVFLWIYECGNVLGDMGKGKLRKRESLDTVQALLSNGQNAGMLLTLFQPQMQSRAPYKVNFIPARPSASRDSGVSVLAKLSCGV